MGRKKAYLNALAGASRERALVVDRIEGGVLEWDARDRPAFVELHYLVAGKPSVMRMPFDDAMAVLSIVKAIQLDTGIPFPDDPRALSARS